MDLSLRSDLGVGYRNRSQIARVVSESWVARELFCPACPADRLETYRPGMKVSDFFCSNCGARFQVKAKSGPFGRSVANSAYDAKLDAIRAGTVPNYVFLGYDAARWRITTGFVVPGHFITPSVIQRRTPLSPTARRAGWVGSNILLGDLPSDARVRLISESVARPAAQVRKDWQRFEFIKARTAESRGWISDVLTAVRSLERQEFHLGDLYAQADRLAALHPNNRHVEEKIRQQVQVLRDQGILGPLGKGRYRVLV